MKSNNIARCITTATDEIFSGPYMAHLHGSKRTIAYNGQKAFPPSDDVTTLELSESVGTRRLKELVHNPRFTSLHKIDDTVFLAAVEYFHAIGADWCNLPLTTLMISSPGEVYAGKTLNYTTDTLPIQLSWFDCPRNIFLSESSQFYLELRLLCQNVDRVFSIYNSFRKEHADYSHLSEFQHIEFEGKVDFEENIKIAEGLLRRIVQDSIHKNSHELEDYLYPDDIEALARSVDPQSFERMTFKEAIRLLFKDTGDPRYKEFSLKHFGSWEEVRLTQIVGRHVWLTEFPMLQIPFYHNQLKVDEATGVPLAENADLIMYGYREVIGAGVRISDPGLLAEKAVVFNLPSEDYQPYLATRDFQHYEKTAGFGLGWQRLLHWMLKVPVIWEAVHIPRGHMAPRP